MAFHLYRINELYSNADGSIQFVELVGLANNQQFLAAHTLTSSQGGTTRSFTFPTNLPGSATLNKSVLIATQGFANLGLVTPDYILPAPFLFTSGGTVNFAESSSVVAYAALPTDGSHSIDANTASTTNSPTNFAGATSSITPIVNNPPTAGTSGDRFTALNESVSLNLGALFGDADGDVLSFGATGLPAGLSINAASGLISGTTPNATGEHHVTVTATDPGNASASLNFHLNIVAGNTVLNNVTTRSGTALPGVVGHEFQSNGNPVTALSRGTADFLVNGAKPITAADALDALKLSVGLNASQGSSWKELIAADINHSGQVTAADALEILKISVGINTVQPSWVFVPTDGAINPNLATMDRTTVSYGDKINLAFTASSSTSVTAILVGDVNNSWVIPA